MQVLVKTDGYPTYHLAVVVDDHLMEITHILRGEEWINSVPKHQLLFSYFGWEMPELVHLPLLRNPDQSKLSKRKNPTSVNYYRDAGILPEALLNYLALMGWSMPDEREIFTLDEMAAGFDVDRVSVRGPIFDQAKLSWLNGQYIRELDEDQFAHKVADWMLNDTRLAALIPLVKDRIDQFSQLAGLTDYLLGDRVALTPDHFEHKKLERADIVRVLFHVSKEFDELREWDSAVLMARCQMLAGRCDMKLRDFLFPLFVAVSGKEVSLPLFDSMAFLGPDLTRVRIRNALDVMGVSGKEKKRLEKELR